ncbi:hypothetical protein GEV33_004112 [Tenebrio molitor]|uniref:Acyl-coenzyme A thioesterase 13 n=1 Tax=Tenebrio molitor TaxID=7067 RepID=A0A8J6LDN5_TENMO|nr:hypothetical protein GEV33_004112 [Tenebrio molitor]
MIRSGIIKDLTGLLNLLKTSPNSFDKVLHKVNILSVGDGKCRAKLKLDEDHLNPFGAMHGGFSATLLDCVSAYALSTKIPGPHASVEIHLSYFKSARKGDDVLIEASVTKTGKKLAFMEVEIKNGETGDLLAKGTHTAFIL